MNATAAAERVCVYLHPPDYLGWPSLAKAADGTLLCVFSAEREAHVCPYGKVALIQSRDTRGEQWDTGRYRVAVSTPLDDRDPGLLVLANGDWLLTWFSLDAGRRLRMYREYYPRQCEGWARHLSKLDPVSRYLWADHWSQRSTDEGKTWETPVQTHVSAPHGPILCPDGRLVYVGTGRNQQLLVMESRTHGRSWQSIGEIIYTSDLKRPSNLTEAHGVAFSERHLLVFWRQEFGQNATARVRLHATASLDGGVNWTKPQPVPIEGLPPHALLLADGRLVLTYGWRKRPYGIRARVLPSGFDLWEEAAWEEIPEYVLASDGLSWDLGYPSTVEVAPGELFTAYYEADAWDCGTIHGLRWRVDDTALQQTEEAEDLG